MGMIVVGTSLNLAPLQMFVMPPFLAETRPRHLKKSNLYF